jgi:hypothetical protein
MAFFSVHPHENNEQYDATDEGSGKITLKSMFN